MAPEVDKRLVTVGLATSKVKLTLDDDSVVAEAGLRLLAGLRLATEVYKVQLTMGDLDVVWKVPFQENRVCLIQYWA